MAKVRLSFPMDISIIILNYKTKGLVKNCLRSIKNADLEGLSYEIIVVDNNSADNIKEMLRKNFPEVKFISADKNLGMGAGNNLGIKNSQGKYIVVINPDIMVLNDALKKMFYFMESNPQIGLVGPKLINPNRSLQYTRCRFPTFGIPIYRRTPLNKFSFIQRRIDLYLTKDQDYEEISKADWIFGACLFIRRKVLDKVGLFDEGFFLGFEDTDLCKRIWQFGFEVWYYPKSILIHFPHRFSEESNWFLGLFNNKNVRIHIKSWIRYFWKWGLG